MSKKRCVFALLAIVSAAEFGFSLKPAIRLPQTQQTPSQQKPAEEVYKNIRVLKGVPASEFEGNMAFISGSLGVRCNYCHVNPFDKDEKPTKLLARKMIQMVLDLNKGTFNREGAVSCFTCHRGQPRPVSVPAVGTNLWQVSGPQPKQPETLPTTDEILNRYVEAVGGKQAIENIKTRVFIGSRVGADGVLVPEEVRAKAPDKLLITTSYPNLVFRGGFNGARAWAKSNETEQELNEEIASELKREAAFYKETKLKELYPNMRVVSKSKVGEKEAYIIEATPAEGGNAVQLFFDVQSGLLIRKYSEAAVTLGRFPTQTDYEDYREVNGVKLPFTIRWSIPGRVWGRKITEVRQNVPLDDSQFQPSARK